MKKNRAITLIEILLSLVIAISAIAAIIMTMLTAAGMMGLSKNMSIALNATNQRIEEISNRINPANKLDPDQIPYDDIIKFYNDEDTAIITVKDSSGNTLSGFSGRSYVKEITDSSPTIWEIKAVVCWRDENGRLIGEDINLNGQLDSGEDLNGNNQIDSSCQLHKSIVRR